MESKVYKLENGTIECYFQKSYKFIYPLLKIDLAHKIMPIQTYMAWQGEVGIYDYKLVCVYQSIPSIAFKHFEKRILLTNEYFDNYKECENDKIVYTFNFKKEKDSIFQFLKGKYSLMSEENKATLLKYYSVNRFSKEYMDSFINPENYYEKYASLLNVAEWRLRETKELCNIYNREKETLFLNKKYISNSTGKLLLF